MSANNAKTKKTLDAAIAADLKSLQEGARNVLSGPAMRYARHMLDPRGAPPVPSVQPLDGTTHVQVVQCHTKGVCQVGTGNIGFVGINPTVTGPYTDRFAAIYSQSGYAGSASTTVPSSTDGTTLVGANWAQAPFTAVGSTAAKVSYRCIAAAIYIYPRSNKLSQDGDIYLLDNPAHAFANTMTFGQIEDHPRSRNLPGAQSGNPVELNVLDWMPRRGYTDEDQIWTFQTTAAASGITSVTLAAFLGTPSVSYHFEVWATYECVGYSCTQTVPRFSDSRGWDLILAAYATRTLSGWVGRPYHAQHSMLAALVGAAKKLGHLAWKNRGKIADAVKDFAMETAGFSL